MKTDQIRWDERYSNIEYPIEVSSVVKEYCQLTKPGKALDIASGNGRNSFFLVEKGFEVDAIEISGIAVGKVKAQNEKINLLQEDLDFYNIKVNEYDLIININFLQRRLFPHIKDALRKDGLLIFQTFLNTHSLAGGVEPLQNDKFLKTNELLHAFLSFQIVCYREEEIVFSNQERREIATLVGLKRNQY